MVILHYYNVFYVYAVDLLKIQLQKANFIAILIDSSNHNDLKIIPILMVFFSLEKGIELNYIEYTDLPVDTSEQLVEYIYVIY